MKNIRLDDGKFADVRIVQFMNTKLYIPSSWVKYYFYDENKRLFGSPDKSLLLRFAPDLYADECPGIVHLYNTKNEIPTMDLRMFDDNGKPIDGYQIGCCRK